MPAQDLLAWLEDKEQQGGAAPAGSPLPAEASPGSAGAVPKHQEAAEVWAAPAAPATSLVDHVQCMRMHARRIPSWRRNIPV